MASGPEGFVSDPRYGRAFERARGLVLSTPRRWRIIYHYDGDGVAAASSLVRGFERLGYPFQATPLLGVERERVRALLASTKGPVLLVDTGSSWLDLYPNHPHPVVVLDHHRYAVPGAAVQLPEHVALVNPLDWGVDGMRELCGSMLAWLFTVFLDPRNWDNASWGLSGAIADRQHVGGLSGPNLLLLDEAVRRSVVVRRAGAPLFGASVGEALARGIDPFVRGISGNPRGADELLRSLSIDPATEPARVAPEAMGRLVAALRARMESAGVLPEFIGVLDQERWFLPSLGMDAEELSHLQNATGRAGIPGVGVALALGDAAARTRAEAAEREWRDGILRGLLRIEQQGVNARSAVRWFESPETTLAGTQAGLAMNYLLPPDRPVLVFSRPEEDPVKVSGRGTLRLVERGLDLSAALRDAASAVGGEGGGHPVASGATVPAAGREKFLDLVDAEVARQIGAGTTA